MSVKQYDGTTEIRTGRQVRDAIRNMNRYDIVSTLVQWLVGRV
jgi:hypothetical protein